MEYSRTAAKLEGKKLHRLKPGNSIPVYELYVYIPCYGVLKRYSNYV